MGSSGRCDNLPAQHRLRWRFGRNESRPQCHRANRDVGEGVPITPRAADWIGPPDIVSVADN
jgi:hypothetical protein